MAAWTWAEAALVAVLVVGALGRALAARSAPGLLGELPPLPADRCCPHTCTTDHRTRRAGQEADPCDSV